MTLGQAQAIYWQAIKVAEPDGYKLSIRRATELRKLAKLLARIGGFEVWEITERIE
jgi:hypothetical protein